MINLHHNKLLGKPVLLVGCGPSMNDSVAKQIMKAKINTIGVNHSFLYNDMKFYPTYHIFNDFTTDFMHVYRDVIEDIENNGSNLVIPTQVHPNYREKLKDPLLYWVAPMKDQYKFFSYDSNDEIVWFSRGQTIIFTALQLAVYLGANPIFLIGVDFTLSQDKKLHNYDTTPLPPKVAKRLNKEVLPSRMKHLEHNAAPALARLGKTVFNLSKISKVDCFIKPDTSLKEALKWLSTSRFSSIPRQPAEQQTAIQA